MNKDFYPIEKLDMAVHMLAEAITIPEIKNFIDLGHAAIDYAKRHKLGKEAIQRAEKITILAEIKLGDVLLATERAKGTRGQLTGDVVGGTKLKPPTKDPTPTLAELGLSKKEASESQILANLPKKERERVEQGKIKKQAET